MAGSTPDPNRRLSPVLPGPESERRYQRVAERIRAAIAQASDLGDFRDLLAAIMARPGRVLAPGVHSRWSAFVLETCQALGGDPDAATDAAVAVEFAATAADLVDDLVDDEWTHLPHPPSRALNATLALSGLAQHSARALAAQLGAERALRIADLIAGATLTACAGEDLDLLLESTPEVSEEQAHAMTQRKSGTLVATACQVGAAVASDDPDVLRLVGAFGGHVGMVAQLLNDLAGVAGVAGQRNTDLRRRKKTVPIAYALRCAREEGIDALLAWYRGDGPPADQDEEQLARLIRDLGALHYTWVVASAHRREALSALRALAAHTGRPEVGALRRLVPAVTIRQN